jgi:hypothetical protein
MKRGQVYLGTVPSKKRVQRICRAISDETGRDKVWQDSKTIVARLWQAFREVHDFAQHLQMLGAAHCKKSLREI